MLLAFLLHLLPMPQEQLDLDKLVVMQKGTLPIILSAPHGGTLAIPGVPVRKGEGVTQFVTVRDINTDLMATKLAAALSQELSGKPYVIVAKFSRKYVDANRPSDGAFESPAAKPVYHAYHRALQDACKEVHAQWGRGLLLDLHGQAVRADAIYRGTRDGKTTTLLTQRFGLAALTGPDGFQGMLEAKGYTLLPPAASNDKETRFNGGYIVQHYGSHTGFGIDAIQLEFGGKYSARARLDQTAKDLAEVTAAFAKRYVLDEKK